MFHTLLYIHTAVSPVQVILPSEEYTSCWDSRTRNARWVVERINVNTITGPGVRKKVGIRDIRDRSLLLLLQLLLSLLSLIVSFGSPSFHPLVEHWSRVFPAEKKAGKFRTICAANSVKMG